jgi:hypothetical protein
MFKGNKGRGNFQYLKKKERLDINIFRGFVCFSLITEDKFGKEEIT